MRIYNSIILLSLLTISVFGASQLPNSHQVGQLNSKDNQCYDGEDGAQNTGESRRQCFKSGEISQFTIARRGSGRITPDPLTVQV